MANNLDLEEQEQLAELKHFWNQWGNLITWVLIAVFGAIAAFNGWNYWQRTQAVQDAAQHDVVRVLGDAEVGFGGPVGSARRSGGIGPRFRHRGT